MDIDGQMRGGVLLRDRMAAEVVAMEGDVEGAGGIAGPPGQTAGELEAAVGDAEEDGLFRSGQALDNARRQPLYRSVYVRRADGLGGSHEAVL